MLVANSPSFIGHTYEPRARVASDFLYRSSYTAGFDAHARDDLLLETQIVVVAHDHVAMRRVHLRTRAAYSSASRTCRTRVVSRPSK
jgi:hypothetical protein